MSDDKLVRFANAIEKAQQKNPGFRWAKIIHDVALTLVFLVVLASCLAYVVEEFTPIEEYIEVLAVVPEKTEFEAREPIMWTPLILVSDLKDIETSTVLRCDSGGGNGYEFVSAAVQPLSTQSLLPWQEAAVESAIQTNRSASFTKITDWMRTFADENEIEPLKYGGTNPAETARCFGEVTVTGKTPILGIPKSVTEETFPFDYIWYGFDSYGDDE